MKQNRLNIQIWFKIIQTFFFLTHPKFLRCCRLAVAVLKLARRICSRPSGELRWPGVCLRQQRLFPFHEKSLSHWKKIHITVIFGLLIQPCTNTHTHTGFSKLITSLIWLIRLLGHEHLKLNEIQSIISSVTMSIFRLLWLFYYLYSDSLFHSVL